MKKLLIFSILGIYFLNPFRANSQGEQLFKAKCNTCHLVDKNSTGPSLKGVKQKWIDAGEGDMIYEWVTNPLGLFTSGKSKMAVKIKDFNASDMTPQAVSHEEIDAILSYVDSYSPPLPPPPTLGNPAEKILTPNYQENLNLFYMLLACTFVLLIAILLLSNSIISLVKSDYFRKKLNEQNANDNNRIKTLLIIFTIGLSLAPESVFAIQFTSPGSTEEPTLWLLVEKSDIYMLLTINIILLSVVLYLRRMFNNFMSMVRIQEEKVVEFAPLKKINQVLTNSVPIEEESKIMLHHEYDGIRELDNNLPPWWVWGFVATIIFAVIYLFNYHVIHVGDLQIKAYEKEMNRSGLEVKAYLSKMAMNVDENSATLMTQADDLSSGKSIFQSNCVTCHKTKGEGDIGPNLTDKTWIYGYDIKELFKTIKLGTPNGMPEHNSKLNPIEIQQVSSYILNLPETNGKDAQGTIIEK